MELLLKNWQLIAIAILAALVALFSTLWMREVREFAEYKGRIEEAGNRAMEEKKRIEKEHQTNLENVSNAWNNQLPHIRGAAVRNYLASRPNGVCPSTDSVRVSGDAGSPQVPDGTGEERVVVEAGFIEDCAEDAGRVVKWKEWAIGAKLPVR